MINYFDCRSPMLSTISATTAGLVLDYFYVIDCNDIDL